MKIITAILFSSILLFFTAFTPLVACEKTRKGEEFPIKTEEQKIILSLWEIDTFEGGMGSRGDYLRKLCEKFIDKGIFVMVSSYTVDGAREKINSGVFPDLVSFGVGAGFTSEIAKRLPAVEFTGGEIGGEIFAYPWCRGGYFLLSKTAINGTIDRLIVSKGDYNNPLLALKYSMVSAKKVEISDPLSAYTDYLKGDAVLLGTQRDIRRLTVRGASFTVKPIEKFCDLFQYISVTTADKNKISYAEEVAKFIYENAGEGVSKIGMLPISGNGLGGALGEYDLSLTEYTLSPFTADDVLSSLQGALSEEKTAEEEAEILKNIIKHL